MKKSLLCMCMLFLLSTAGLIAIHHSIAQEGQALTWTESTYQGDPAAAHGLSAQLAAHYDYRLLWDTTLPFGPQPETTCSFSSKPRTPAQGPNSYGVYMNTFLNSGWRGDIPADELDGLHPVHKAMLTPLIEQTENGTTRTKTVQFRDYCPYYPMQWEVSIPHNDLHYWASREIAFKHNPNSMLLYDLADAFCFPVTDDFTVDLSVTKDEAGNLTDLSISSSDPPPYCNTWSHVTEASAYLIPEMITPDGKLLDSSHTPHGRGIYRLSCADRTLTMDDLAFLYPISDQQTVLNLVTDDSGQRLLLATAENGVTVVHVLDAASGQELQTLTPWNTVESRVTLLVGEGCWLILRPGGQFWLYALDENGQYVPQFPGQLPDAEEFPMDLGSHCVLAYDGQRLAILCDQRFRGDLRVHCSLMLAVFDREGLQYAGTYESSLDQCRNCPEEYSSDSYPLCDYFGADAIHLRWDTEPFQRGEFL